MYGAIIGDIVGSRFEFDRGDKSRGFELFADGCDYTDDTVMTVAVAEALMDAGKDAGEAEVKCCLIASMKRWGKRYPYAGYGARFIDWVLTDDPKPYGSYGNGSGMRVSAAGWLYDSLDRTREVARWTAEVTHNHPEGIKGAESVAAAIFMARKRAKREEIREYLEQEFGYDLSRTLDEIRPGYKHVEDCMRTMPGAFECFLEAESYEETLRNVMYIGGDTDTLCAIAGAVAEACWGVPLGIITRGKDYLTEDIMEVVNRFRQQVTGGNDPYRDNLPIKAAVAQVLETKKVEDLMGLIAVILTRISQEGEAPTPMDDINNVMGQLALDEKTIGDSVTLGQDLHLKITRMVDGNGDKWVPLFTDEEEMNRQPTSNLTMIVAIRSIIDIGFRAEDVKGVVINPFGQNMMLDKELLKLIDELLKHPC